MEKEFFFENLEVCKRSLELSILICRKASSFPFKFNKIREQLIGAVISVPLNIAEGSGRRSIKEKRNFYRISLTSLFGCIPLLEICDELKLITKEEKEKFRKEITELSKMISSFTKSLHS